MGSKRFGMTMAEYQENAAKRGETKLSDSKLKLEDGQTACVRWLTNGEDEFYVRLMIHEGGDNRSYRSVACDDQNGGDDCECCNAGIATKFLGMVLCYVYEIKSIAKGKEIIEPINRVMFWPHSNKWGKVLAKRIAGKGFSGYDCEISRLGENQATVYSFEYTANKKFDADLKKSDVIVIVEEIEKMFKMTPEKRKEIIRLNVIED